jgi:ribosomal protein S8
MFGNITRAHKNSTEWKLAERQLHIKNAKNYRGITVTPTLSKIIEKILKIIVLISCIQQDLLHL